VVSVSRCSPNLSSAVRLARADDICALGHSHVQVFFLNYVESIPHVGVLKKAKGGDFETGRGWDTLLEIQDGGKDHNESSRCKAK